MTVACSQCGSPKELWVVEPEATIAVVEYKKSRKAFGWWFSQLVLQQPTCLLRDIIRNQKESLFQEWLRMQPMGEP